MKLRSFYKDNIYIITQSPHCGSAQDCKAMDFGFLGYGDKNLYAPCDMTFKRSWNDGVEYWVNGCEGVYIQFVHIKPVNNGNKSLGQLFGSPIKDHGHIAVYDKKWDLYLNYADRSAELFFWKLGQKHDKWTNWATYADLQFSCYTKYEMVTLQIPIKIKTTNTAPLNVRAEPNTTSAIITKIPTSTEFTTNIVASGTEVNGNKNWYGVLGGYVSGAYVQELPQVSDCSAQEAQIVELEQQIKQVNLQLAVHEQKVVNFKDEVRKAIESYNIL